MPKIYFGTGSLDHFRTGSVLTIGAFDGVHKGHQLIIERLRQRAKELGLPSVALTFYPDPVAYFDPANAPTQIMSLREKALALLEAGVDAVVCLPFNETIRTMSAAEFVRQVLHAGLGAKFIIVGDDFRFGNGREGDFQLLCGLGAEFEFEVEQCETHAYRGERISSTRIRRLLAAGNFAEVEDMLGRPYAICGRVVRGQKLGRNLGFPTANLPLRRTRPALSGVFAVRAQVADTWFEGAANLGNRPAVNSLKRPLLEVHLLDFSGDLYGQRIKVTFAKKLRDEQDFPDLTALKNAIEKDVDDARTWFRNNSQALSANTENEVNDRL